MSTVKRFPSRVIWLTGVLLFMWGATTVLAGPRIVLDHREHHFGTLTQGKIVVHRFPLTNGGDETLTLTDVSTPCGCTAALPDKSTLAPGESTAIEVTYDSAARSGEVVRIITVMSNDPIEPELELRLVADVDASMHKGFQAGEALFGLKCGSCHADPLAGQQGQALYDVGCWFCHGKAREGKTGPALGQYPDSMTGYLRATIRKGHPGTEMPGFALDDGGPLLDPQVESLIELLKTAPPSPPPPEETNEASHTSETSVIPPADGEPLKVPFFQ